MKTKDIIKHLISVEGDCSRFDAVMKVVGDLILETKEIQNARKATSNAAIIAIQRETFGKWKAVVSGLKAIEADYPAIGVNLYPVMIMELSPSLFLDCYSANAYLGMEMTEFLTARVQQLRNEFTQVKAIAQFNSIAKMFKR